MYKQRVPYHIRLSPIFSVKISTYYSKNLAFSTNKILIALLIFSNGSFFLNFLISPPYRNLDPLTRSNLIWDTVYLNNIERTIFVWSKLIIIQNTDYSTYCIYYLPNISFLIELEMREVITNSSF